MLSVILDVAKPVFFSRSLAIGAGGLCALPALELANCAFQCFANRQHVNPAPPDAPFEQKKTIEADIQRNRELRDEAISRIVPAALLGTALFNFYPGTAACGALFLLLFAKSAWKKEAHINQGRKGKHFPCYSILFLGAAITLRKEIFQMMQLGAHKCARAAKAVFRLLGKGVKAIGRGCATVLALPGKALKGVARAGAKLARPVVKATAGILKHPKLTVGVAVGAVGVFLAVRHGEAAGQILSFTVRSVFATVGLLFQGFLKGFQAAKYLLSHSIGLVGTALLETLKFTATVVSYVPSAVYQTVKFIF